MDKPRFDHCENYCYGPEGHYCLLWKSNLKNCCYSDSVCDAQNILEVDIQAEIADWYVPSEPPL